MNEATAGSWQLSTEAVIAVVAIGLLASAFFSGCETGYMGVSRVRLHRRERHGRRARILRRHLREVEDPIMTCLIGTNLGNVIISAVLTAWLTARFSDSGEWLAVLVSSVLIILLAEMLPKVLYREFPERLMLASAPLVAVFMRVVAPLRWLLRGYSVFWRRLLPPSREGEQAGLDRQNLVALLLTNSVPATQDHRFRETMDRFLQLGQRDLRQIMRAPAELVTVPQEATLAECLRIAARSGYSRLPLVDGKGALLPAYLRVHDLLLDLDTEERQPATGEADAAPVPDAAKTGIPRTLWRSFLMVDVGMSPYELFEELHGRGSPLALVVDGGGQPLGLVTLEDLTELVVGAIQDEFDTAQPAGGSLVSGGA